MGSALKKLGAEYIGTFWLVLGGCGSVVLACANPNWALDFVGVSIAFGLTVLTMANATGIFWDAISIRRYLLGCG
jgi:aquaporin Z